jgi:hypothetical protein
VRIKSISSFKRVASADEQKREERRGGVLRRKKERIRVRETGRRRGRDSV